MQITPEVQAQLDEQKKNCPFCKIIEGTIPSKIVYQDDLVIAILDINPVSKAHILVMPKNHYPILPYLPPETFKHMFGLIPKFADIIKKSTFCSGVNVFVANGAAAGQMSPHFLIHIFSREKGDNLDLYSFDKSKIKDLDKFHEVNKLISHNLPIALNNHFKRVPSPWHNGSNINSDFLSNFKNSQDFIYEDEKTLCLGAKSPLTLGHVEIYSKEEFKLIEKLDSDTSSHLFFVASFTATMLFEGLGCHGTNIILKSGYSFDNASEILSIHVFPRFNEDGFELIGKPIKDKSEISNIYSKLKDLAFDIKLNKSQPKPIEVKKISPTSNILDEIKNAINSVKKS